jgi:hypothetical protein
MSAGTDCSDCGPRILGQHSVFSVEPRPPPPPFPPPAPSPPPAPTYYIRGPTNNEIANKQVEEVALGYQFYDWLRVPMSNPSLNWRTTTNDVYHVCYGDGTSYWKRLEFFEMCVDVCSAFYGVVCSYSDVLHSSVPSAGTARADNGYICVYRPTDTQKIKMVHSSYYSTSSYDTAMFCYNYNTYSGDGGRRRLQQTTQDNFGARISPRPPPSPPSSPPPSPGPRAPPPFPPPSPASPPAPPGYYVSCGCHCFTEDETANQGPGCALSFTACRCQSTTG